MSRVKVVLCVGLALGAGLALRPLEAQQQTPTYQFLMSREEVRAHAAAARRGLNYVPGEVIIKFREGTTTTGQMRAMDSLRSRPLPQELQWIADRTARLRVATDPDSIGIAANLSRQPEVEYAHPNWLLKTHSVPNDTSYAARQWNMSALSMPSVWDINTGNGIIVAVIDTGVTSVNATYSFPTWDGAAIVQDTMEYAINPDLDINRFTGGRDFIFWNGPVLDMDGHGTHVAGTVAQSTNNSLGFAGMAYNARIMPLKVCYSYWDLQILASDAGEEGFFPPGSGGCSNSAINQAIRYAADNGAKVINMSLGGTNPSQSTRDSLEYAVSRGVFIALSAGNEFNDGNPTTYPASYAPAIAGVMSVGAVGRSLTRAGYSTTGEFVEIAAPGGNFSDGGSAGAIWQAGLLGSDFNEFTVIFPRFDRYTDVPLQGTSMASPHVAGLAALLMSQGVTSPAAVEALITRTAQDLGTKGKDNDFGHGFIQPRAALRGFGLIR